MSMFDLYPRDVPHAPGPNPIQIIMDMLSGQGGAEPPAAEPMAAPNFQVPAANDPAFPTSGGGGGGGQYTPQALGYAPDRTVDPALAGRESYAQAREGRIGELVRQALARNQGHEQWSRPWWQRLLGVVGPLAGAEPGTMGTVGARTLAGWSENDQRLQDRALQLELAMEDERGRTAETGFARQSGEHQVGEGNRQARYGVDVANVQQGNQAEQFNVNESNQTARAGAAQQLQLAIARYQALTQQQETARQAVLSQGGQGAFGAFGQMVSPLGPEITQQALERQARNTLQGVIAEQWASRENDSARRTAVHEEMERIAGRPLTRPPNATFRSPSAAATWYARNGVPLDSQELLVNFGGFGGGE